MKCLQKLHSKFGLKTICSTSKIVAIEKDAKYIQSKQNRQ